MGNQCCGSQPVQRDQSEMAFQPYLGRYPEKKRAESSRFYQIFQSKKEQGGSFISNTHFSGQDMFSSDRTEEFILTLKSYNHLETPDSISIDMKIKTHDYSYKSDMDWKIDEDVIIDPNCFETSLMRVTEKKTGNRYALKVINFDDHEDYNFKAALYQIHILRTIAQEIKDQNIESPNFAMLHDSYILENEEKEHHKGSIIMLMDFCDTTLHEIIQFRKMHKWPWTDQEIIIIFYQLAQAISTLEKLQLVHRDIRPHNIWYCSKQKKYLLGGFEDAKFIKKAKTDNSQLGLNFNAPSNVEPEDLLNTIRSVPDYLPPEVRKYHDGHTVVGKYNASLCDVYQLGLCIAMMLHLEIDCNNQELSEFIGRCKGDRHSFGSKSFQDLLKMMLVADEKSRLTPAELPIYIAKFKTSEDIPVDEDNLLKSLKFKIKVQGMNVIRIYQLIAQAYYDLFEWDKWQEKMEEILVTFESNKEDVCQAECLYDIANGFLDIDNLNRAQDYFMKASILYNEIGHEKRKTNDMDLALEYYQKSLDCIRKAHNGEDSFEGAMMLENLGNVYRLRGESKKARSYLEESLRIVEQERGVESLEAAKVLVNLGKIYLLLGDNKQAEKRIKKALKISENPSNTQSLTQSYTSGANNSSNSQQANQLMKASALCALGEVIRLKSGENPRKLEKAKKHLEEAYQIRQQIQGSGHLEIASTLENLGNVYYQLQDFHTAKTLYEKTLVIKKNKLGEEHVEVAITLNNIGNTCKMLNELEKASNYYTTALKILKKSYPDDKHPLVGTTYGNLGKILKEQGNSSGAQQCLSKGVNILQEMLEPDHPDLKSCLNEMNDLPNQRT